MLNIRRKGLILASTLAAFFGILAATPALADTANVDQCHSHNSDSSIVCTGGTKWCGNTCQASPTPTGTQDVNCSTCTTVCAPATPCGYPACTAPTSSPAGTVSCSGNGSCPANGGVYTDQCSSAFGCPTGKTRCTSPNSCATTLSCPSGFTFDPCANGGLGACVSPYVVLSPGAQQTGFINISGDLTSGGDLYMANGKAIRVDGSGVTDLNIGNWGGGATGLNVNAYGRLKVDGTAGELNINRASTSFVNRIVFSTAGVNDWQIGQGILGPGFAIKRISSPPDVGPATFYIDQSDNVGIGTQTPGYKLHVAGTFVVGAAGSGFGGAVPSSSWAISAVSPAAGGGGVYSQANLANANAVYGRANVSTANGIYGEATVGGTNGVYGSAGNATAIGGYFRNTAGGEALRVDNQAVFNGGLRIATGAAAGRFLQSDASGNASWVVPPTAPVSSVTGSGAGITVSPTTGAVLVQNTGVTSLVAGSGISVSGGTGAVTVSNTGVIGTGTAGRIAKFTAASTLGNTFFSEEADRSLRVTDSGAATNYISIDPWVGSNGQAISFWDGGAQKANLYYNRASNIFLVNSAGAANTNIGGASVGIGTSTPENKLHIFKGSAGAVTANANSPLVVENSTSNYIHVLSPDATEQGILFGDPSADISTAIISGTGNQLEFRAGGNTSRMTVDQVGNVGIGTTGPTAKLHVSAGDSSLALFGPNSSWAGKLYVGASPNQGVAATAQVISTDGNLHLDAAPNKNMYLGYYQARDTYINVNGGNVGIGTASPGYRLDVNGNVHANTVYTDNWFRSYGVSGWYNETYQGGWFMQDSTWIRAYNGKGVVIDYNLIVYGSIYLSGWRSTWPSTSLTTASSAIYSGSRAWQYQYCPSGYEATGGAGLNCELHGGWGCFQSVLGSTYYGAIVGAGNTGSLYVRCLRDN